tara:strand:- start:866 stop:1051 length:186 start_codon:yes stop_codon:yes gene_type:complete
MGKVIYSYFELENICAKIRTVVDRERKLHPMDMTIMEHHLDDLEYEIIPALEEIIYYDPTP